MTERLAEHRHLDVLVNNAGVGNPGTVTDTSNGQPRMG